MLVIWFLVPLPFLNPTWTSGSSQFTHCWSLAWNFEHYFTSVWDEYQLRLSAKCHFQGLKTGLCLVPTGLRASPRGNQHWWRDSVCVCVCVCTRVCAVSLIYFQQMCFLCSNSLWADGEGKLCSLVCSSVCLKYTFMMNVNVGEEADRQAEVYPFLKSLVLCSGSTGGGFDPRKHLTMSGDILGLSQDWGEVWAPNIS